MNKIKIIVFTCLLITSCKNKLDIEPGLITLTQTSIDSIKVNDTVTIVIDLKNDSNIELKIQNIGLACGCLLIEDIPKTINPKSNQLIKIKYTPAQGSNGYIQKTILIKGNIQGGYKSFNVKSIVKLE